MNCLKHVISLLKSFQWLLISVRAKAKIPRMANKILCSQPPVIFYFLHCTHSSLFAVPGKFQACSFIGAFELPHPSAWNFLLPDAAWLTSHLFSGFAQGPPFQWGLVWRPRWKPSSPSAHTTNASFPDWVPHGSLTSIWGAFCGDDLSFGI